MLHDVQTNGPVDVKIDDKPKETVDEKIDEPKTTKQKQQNAYVQPVSRSWRARLTYL